eukprot:scaffold16039_cov39-Prasinocladus_malaysianus.AAC.1
MLLTNKDSTPGMYKALAIKFSDELMFSEIHQSQKQVGQLSLMHPCSEVLCLVRLQYLLAVSEKSNCNPIAETTDSWPLTGNRPVWRQGVVPIHLPGHSAATIPAGRGRQPGKLPASAPPQALQLQEAQLGPVRRDRPNPGNARGRRRPAWPAAKQQQQREGRSPQASDN